MSAAPIVVIGAGIGGLSAAAMLAARGEKVVVLERHARSGGKMREVAAGGQRVDAGPTVFTMRWVFDRLFDAAGENLDAAIDLIPTEVLARHAWDDRAHFDLFADQERSTTAIGDFFGAREARGYRDFCREAAGIYEVLRDAFMDVPRPSPLGMMARIGLARLPQALAIRPHQPLWRAVSRHFADPRLRQLFGRYATYCGSSPFVAPATLMLIAHVEREGVWLVAGGMYRVAEAIEALAMRGGAAFRHDAHVAEVLVEGGRACGVRLAGGEVIAARAVICNADPAALATGLLGDAARTAVPPVPPVQRSLSSFTWMLSAETGGFPLVRHNVFFSQDYPAEFAAIFGAGQVPEHPTVYICAQDRDDHGARTGTGPGGGTGPERLQLIVNAPANGDTHRYTEAEMARCAARTFALLERCGLSVARRTDATVLATPTVYEGLFPATGGALYGRANHGWQAPFQRPGSASRIPGLYLAGGGTHPGAGIPMASLSGQLAAARVLADLALR